METNIKPEISDILCHGCLSRNRQMLALEENTDVYYSFIGIQKHCSSDATNNVMLCWECAAILKKCKTFLTQIRKAQDVLTQFLNGHIPLPEPFSNLVTTTRTYCDREIIYESESNKSKNETEDVDALKNEFTFELKLEDFIDDSKSEIEYVINKNETLSSDKEIFEETNDFSYLKVRDYDLSVNDVVKNDKSAIVEDRDDNIEIQLKEEPKTSEIKETKTKRIRFPNFVQNSIPIKAKKIVWDDYKSNFNILYYYDEEFEREISTIERRQQKRFHYKFHCSICKLGYRNLVDFNRHNDLNHRKEDAPLKCSFCHTTVSTEAEFQSHWRTHTAVAKCKLCGCVVRPRGMAQHLTYMHVKRYACKKCGGGFGTRSAFVEHFQNDHISKFICDYCNMTFKDKKKIAKHIKDTHEPVFCVECNKTFANRKRYEAHCQLLHPETTNGEKIANEDCYCVECNKQYKSIQQYREHLNYSIKHVNNRKKG